MVGKRDSEVEMLLELGQKYGLTENDLASFLRDERATRRDREQQAREVQLEKVI